MKIWILGDVYSMLWWNEWKVTTNAWMQIVAKWTFFHLIAKGKPKVWNPPLIKLTFEHFFKKINISYWSIRIFLSMIPYHRLRRTKNLVIRSRNANFPRSRGPLGYVGCHMIGRWIQQGHLYSGDASNLWLLFIGNDSWIVPIITP
jgi:hypothetical protein